VNQSIYKRIEKLEKEHKDKDKYKIEFVGYHIFVGGVRVLPFDLRPYQIKTFNNYVKGDIKKVFSMHPRRSGKTFLLFYTLCYLCLKNRNTNAYHLFPEQDQAFKVIWSGIIIDKANNRSINFIDLFPRSICTPNHTRMLLKFNNGSTLRIVGTSSSDRIRGITSNLIGISEYSFCKAYLLPVVTPVIIQSEGRLLLESTPNGMNFALSQFYNFKYTNSWITDKQTCLTLVDENNERYITDGDIQEAVDNGLSTGLIQQEFYCNPVLDAHKIIYGHEMGVVEIVDRLYNPMLAINLAFDLGINDKCSVIAFQVRPQDSGINIIWCYENNNLPWLHYIELIRKEFIGKHIGKWILPHDSKKRDGSSITLDTVHDYFEKLGCNVETLPRPRSLTGLIMMIKGRFSSIVIEKSCIELIDALNNYQYDDNRKPLHDGSSHMASAFSYAVMAVHTEVITGRKVNLRAIRY
jgi:hypothetical protein